MNEIPIQTVNLKLVLKTPDDVRMEIKKMSPSEKAELSADWLEQIRNTTLADPWLHGFDVVQKINSKVIGSVGFKGPPSSDGIVEIAYSIAPEYQNKGYATEAAQALVSYAFGSNNELVFRAHTLPEQNASTRVLTKCKFRRVAEVVNTDDGLVWRWEKSWEEI